MDYEKVKIKVVYSTLKPKDSKTTSKEGLMDFISYINTYGQRKTSHEKLTHTHMLNKQSNQSSKYKLKTWFGFEG